MNSFLNNLITYEFQTFRGDIYGGITSTVVALPVALSFGVASGMGAEAGLYSAIAVIITTHATTLGEALTVVVMSGLVAAGMMHAQQLETLELDSVISVPLLDQTFFSEYKDMTTTDPYSARVGLVALKGSFTVASSRKLVEVIGKDIKDHEVVIFDFSETTYLDDSSAMVVEKLMGVATEKQTGFIAMGLSMYVAHTLNTFDILRDVPQDHVVETLNEAKQVAYNLIERRSTGNG